MHPRNVSLTTQTRRRHQLEFAKEAWPSREACEGCHAPPPPHAPRAAAAAATAASAATSADWYRHPQPRWRRPKVAAFLLRSYCLEARFECWEEMAFAARNPRLHSLHSLDPGRSTLLALGCAALAVAWLFVVWCVCRGPPRTMACGGKRARATKAADNMA